MKGNCLILFLFLSCMISCGRTAKYPGYKAAGHRNVLPASQDR